MLERWVCNCWNCAGANVNSSSPIIGSPLHVAVADNVPNRVELMSLLLSAGANPNLVIDSDEGPPLRPVLAEYVGSNDQPSPVIVKLLLRFGAKVQSQPPSTFRFPDNVKCCRFSQQVRKWPPPYHLTEIEIPLISLMLISKPNSTAV